MKTQQIVIINDDGSSSNSSNEARGGTNKKVMNIDSKHTILYIKVKILIYIAYAAIQI